MNMRSLIVELKRNPHNCPLQAGISQLQHATTFKYTFEEVLFTKTSSDEAIHHEVTQKTEKLRETEFLGTLEIFLISH